MNKQTFQLLEHHMRHCMRDSAHDTLHVYRVLHNALEIASHEDQVDYDVLIAATLLHDIGRQKQLEDPAVCHAQAGSDMAYAFLLANGFPPEFASDVRNCVKAHRFRRSSPPESIEAKIFFDADKLDAAGALGIARTLQFAGKTDCPLYAMNEDGTVRDEAVDPVDSYFREYRFKLCRLYDHFYTTAGQAIAMQRKKAAEEFHNALLSEVKTSHDLSRLDSLIEP